MLERGERPDAELQQRHVAEAVAALVPLARDHELVITHGNGPQVGVLAIESAGDTALSSPYPFDVLGAETQGMIGYWLLQAFENALPGRRVASIVCQTVVDADDPAFANPTKFVGPAFSKDQAQQLASTRSWEVRQDGKWWRRVVASPEPVELVELAVITDLLNDGVMVICSGGGGIPVVRHLGVVYGIEAVIDKDRTAALLARSHSRQCSLDPHRCRGSRSWLRDAGGGSYPPGHRCGVESGVVSSRFNGSQGGGRVSVRRSYWRDRGNRRLGRRSVNFWRGGQERRSPLLSEVANSAQMVLATSDRPTMPRPR